MPKLFVAIDLPADAAAALVLLQPPAAPLLRRVEPGQMHLTIHFLGESDVEPIAAALATVAVPAFLQSIEGVGQFPTAGGSITLWAGVPAAPGLLQLREAVAAVLADIGLPAEARPFNPHLTLARGDAGCSPALIEEFLRKHAAASFPAVPITSFGLFSSTFVDGAPVYRCERRFPLRPAAGNP